MPVACSISEVRSVVDAPAAKPREGWAPNEARRDDDEGAKEQQAAAAAAAAAADDACFFFFFKRKRSVSELETL